MTPETLSLVNRFDRILARSEASTIAILQDALTQSFDRLELELRRKYPQMAEQGGLLAAQRNTAVLLQQIRALLSLIDPAQAKKLDAEMLLLLQSSGAMGTGLAIEMMKTVDSGLSFKPQVPIEAVTYAAQDSVGRLQRHGDDFARRSAGIIAQGLIQNWSMSQTIKLMKDQMAVTRSQAETIVRTESMQAMVSAQVATFEGNGVRYLMRATAHGDRVCPICAARSGEVLPVDKMIVILHPRCRCVGTPVLPNAVKLGLQSFDWAEKFHADVIKALPDGVKLNYSGLAPFEKSSGMKERPKPVWTPKDGFLDKGFERACSNG